jgi:uncharacterized protein (TIGR03435 family)
MSMLIASILAKVTLTTALALAGARLARHRPAAVRHVVLAAAFAALVVLPIASTLAPAITVRVPIAVPTHGPVVPPGRIVDEASAAAPVTGTDAAAPTTESSWPSWSALVIITWGCGAVLFLLPMIAGLWQVRGLRRTGLPWPSGAPLIEPLARDAGIRRRVGVLLHESVPGPMTCGVFRPVVILPPDAVSWPEEAMRRAIVHELEHVRRGDWLSQCLARLVAACYWFHPLVWIAWRQLALEAERACDDAVLRRSEPTAYADQLVVLARRLSVSPRQPQLAMATRRDLATRVLAVLDTHQRRGRAGAASVVFAFAAAAVIVTTISPLRIVAAAIASGQSAGGEKFEVISIKPCQSEPPTTPGQRSSQGGFPMSSPGRFSFECGTVERLISTAYVMNGEPLTNSAPRIGDVDWLKGLPGWVRSDKFTIEAKAEGTPDRKVMLGPMLRALLEDRFNLKLHRATGEAAMYRMTVAKGGLKIQPIGPDGCLKVDFANVSGPDEYRALSSGPTPVCGNMNMSGTPSERRWSIGGTTLKNFAGTLSAFMDRHVIDDTGVPGEFNIRLEFVPDEHVPGPDKRGLPSPPIAAAETTLDPGGPGIIGALEKQLGLKLESTKGPRGFLVIDHVERPTPNSGPGLLDLAPGGRAAGAAARPRR